MERATDNPQVACVNFFKEQHPNATDDDVQKVGRHPNGYFDAAKKLAGL